MKKLQFVILSVITFALAFTLAPHAPASAATGKACFDACRAELTRTNGWKTLPRGYCRKKCNYYAGAPNDVLRKAGRKAGSAACLGTCRAKVRAEPGFRQNPANRRYCKDKCGVP